MIFKKYSSIENSYNKKSLSKFDPSVFTEQFIVQEKIHGASFQFIYDGNELKVASRNNILDNPDSFYNSNTVISKYEKDIIKIFDFYKVYKKFSNKIISQINVYGELFGGNSNNNVKSNYKQIQKGIFYTPEIEFMVFDIRIIYDDMEDEFISQIVLRSLFKSNIFSLKLVPEIAIVNRFDEALNISNEFNSKVPQLLGYDEYAPQDNICEGVVIKPFKRDFYNYYEERLIVKNKNEKWSEKVHNNTPKQTQIIENKLYDLILTYITENRLKNVISKIGNIEQTDFGKLQKMFSLDILDDFKKENETYDEKEFDISWKATQKHISNLIRNNFINIVNGEF